ncbi:MAG: hypothetical protein GXO65_04860 [Euryarchaeota archaeon]|nr:hypothetical protein [Euryarchaeota archaeon]
MEIGELLQKSQEAFRSMDWEALARVNREIMDSGIDGRNLHLAEGLYHYARAKMEDDPGKVISELEKARAGFEGTDEMLSSMARAEALILLAALDSENRAGHLKELGELALKDFTRTGEVNQLRLAIRALEEAMPLCGGEDSLEISKNLTFCLASYAPHCGQPREVYERILEVSQELARTCASRGNRPDLARARMNTAIASQMLAFTKDRALVKEALDSAREAVGIFEEEALQLEMVRAKQALANILKDAARLYPEAAGEYLEEALGIQREVSAHFGKDEYHLNQAYADMETAATLMELAELAGEGEGYLGEARTLVEGALGTFQAEKKGLEFGQAKMALGVILKKQGEAEAGAGLLREAAEIFDREGAGDLKEKARELAGK